MVYQGWSHWHSVHLKSGLIWHLLARRLTDRTFHFQNDTFLIVEKNPICSWKYFFCPVSLFFFPLRKMFSYRKVGCFLWWGLLFAYRSDEQHNTVLNNIWGNSLAKYNWQEVKKWNIGGGNFWVTWSEYFFLNDGKSNCHRMTFSPFDLQQAISYF